MMASGIKQSLIPVYMAGGHHVVSDAASSTDDSGTTLVGVKNELELERTRTRHLRREKDREVQEVRDTERTRASIALKELRSRNHRDKQHQLELQKDTLCKRFEAEFIKLSKQRDSEVKRLQGDLQRCRDKMDEQSHKVLSDASGTGHAGARNGSFVADRSKLLTDLHEMRRGKRKVEEELQQIVESDRKNAREIQDLHSQEKVTIMRLKKEAAIDIRKLLDEIKNKDRLINKMESNVVVSRPPQHANMPTMKKIQTQFNCQLTSPPALSLSTSSLESCGHDDDVSDMTDNGVSSICSDITSGIESMTSSLNDDFENSAHSPDDSQLKDDLSRQLESSQQTCSELVQQHETMVHKLSILEKKHKPLKEKLKLFLEKNIELTNSKRHLEDKVKQFKHDITKKKKVPTATLR